MVQRCRVATSAGRGEARVGGCGLWDRAQRLTAWSGGPIGLAAIVVAQLLLALVFAISPPLAVAAVFGLAAVVIPSTEGRSRMRFTLV